VLNCCLYPSHFEGSQVVARHNSLPMAAAWVHSLAQVVDRSLPWEVAAHIPTSEAVHSLPLEVIHNLESEDSQRQVAHHILAYAVAVASLASQEETASHPSWAKVLRKAGSDEDSRHCYSPCVRQDLAVHLEARAAHLLVLEPLRYGAHSVMKHRGDDDHDPAESESALECFLQCLHLLR
jgi:hypothetical protein